MFNYFSYAKKKPAKEKKLQDLKKGDILKLQEKQMFQVSAVLEDMIFVRELFELESHQNNRRNRLVLAK